MFTNFNGSYNPDFDTDKFRFVFSSLSTPSTVFEYNMTSKTKELLKQNEVIDTNFKIDNYENFLTNSLKKFVEYDRPA